MNNETILVERKDDIVTLIINRPKALNAINMDVMHGLNSVFTSHADD